MKNFPFLPAVLCLLTVSSGAAASEAAEVDINARPTITVTGHGENSVPPTAAYITLGVEQQAPQATEALDANNKSMQQLMEVLESQGIAAKNIQTTAFDISPVYRHEEGERPTVVGYRVSNQVRVKVLKLDSLGNLLDAVVRVGANRIHSIQFDVDDAEEATDKARKTAVEDARRKAELLAAAAGARVGRPLQIQERTGGGEPPMPMARMMMARESVPIAQGEQQLTADVTVTYELLAADGDEP